MSSARIVHSPLPDATPEQARDARARAWAFVFDCARRRSAVGATPTSTPRHEPKHINNERRLT
jgi:hypothetical protein